MDSQNRPAKVKLSGAVMTHPRRLEEARLLAAADPHRRIEVVVDPEPEGRPTALRVAPLSWDCVAPDATHHLVLQDDVELADGFFAYVEQVAAAAGDEAVAFYAGWETRNGGVARLAALTGAPWAYALQEHVPCYALLLPADVARGYARFQAEDEPGWPYDVVVQRYLNARGVPVRFCTPSLVQHMDMPSLAGNAYHGFRQATLFADRAGEPTTHDSVRFDVVPFYQYGLARCAVRTGAGWEYVETERHLRRTGLLDACLAALASAAPHDLPEQVRRAVWVTGFAIGAVTADAPEADPRVAAAAMATLGPGGLCEDYGVDDLLALSHPVRDLALAALDEGRKARRPDGPAVGSAPRARTVVTGGVEGFGRQLAGLLGDLDHRAEYLAAPPANPSDLAAPPLAALVHLGRPAEGPEALRYALRAAEAAGAERLLYAGSAAVYRGGGERTLAEGDLTGPPGDPVALTWWQEEELCRAWGERTGIPVQVLRLADPVGPHAARGTASVDWVHLAWTRQPLALDPRGVHQVLDYRDMAAAIDAVLAAEPSEPVFNVASATFGEEELAGLVAGVSRRTPWETGSADRTQRWRMTTDLITAGPGWSASESVTEGLRDLAQWYACDVHGGDDLPA
ncbi:NAD-dependent epimerase/dehydratase family protein [Streptomyces sp. NPDC098789]|uniref:NAD-dependent epimerase/dehydratase family protein n=1 Tax=Streptomyces sp. NPDC098789 TaxID=3366098 RepID=UPI003810155F